MKRNLDLCTKILLAIEGLPPAQGWHILEFKDVGEVKLSYHIKLLHDVELIEARNQSTKDGFVWVAGDLTWKGHDFLEKAREPIWVNEIKKKALNKGVDLIFQAIKYKLGQYMGIPMI